MANSADPDGFFRSQLIWIYTVCKDRVYLGSAGQGLNHGIAPEQRSIQINVFLIITKTCLFKYTENFTTKKWKFSDKKILIFFTFLLKNIDCGYSLELPWWGSSNKYPQSIFLSRNKKNKVYPWKPQFYYIKVRLRGSKLHRHVLGMISMKPLHNIMSTDSWRYVTSHFVRWDTSNEFLQHVFNRK